MSKAPLTNRRVTGVMPKASAFKGKAVVGARELRAKQNVMPSIRKKSVGATANKGGSVTKSQPNRKDTYPKGLQEATMQSSRKRVNVGPGPKGTGKPARRANEGTHAHSPLSQGKDSAARKVPTVKPKNVYGYNGMTSPLS